jgi:hypothetical protein
MFSQLLWQSSDPLCRAMASCVLAATKFDDCVHVKTNVAQVDASVLKQASRAHSFVLWWTMCRNGQCLTLRSFFESYNTIQTHFVQFSIVSVKLFIPSTFPMMGKNDILCFLNYECEQYCSQWFINSLKL